jgi:protein gp37
MASGSKIEWTQATWNPVTGCTKVSPGCAHCYAERMSRRLKAIGQPRYSRGFTLSVHDDALNLPLAWKKPQMVFVNSMSDLFHKDVPLSFIKKVFEVIAGSSRHQFQVLTKRAERLAELSPHLAWPTNLWMGVSVENAQYTFRIDLLRAAAAKVKFISFEPLLGPLDNVNLKDIDWVIVGGESGPQARPMQPEWVESIRDQCLAANVPFFFKQWGGRNKKKAGRVLDGRIWDAMPVLEHFSI